MSKVWKKPIHIPTWVVVHLDSDFVKVTWPKWMLEQSTQYVDIKQDGEMLIVSSTDLEKTNYRGLYRALIQNMVVGVSTWFEKKLLVYGVWYNVKETWKILEFSLWLSHKKTFTIPDGVAHKLEKDPKGSDVIVLSSHDKQLLWQVCDQIKALKRIEPYKGTGIRFLNEYIKLKPGKAASK